MAGRDDWQRYRDWTIDLDELGFRLDVSRCGLDAAALARMAAPLQAAFDAMDDLERGAIANPDERRMVGHYWLRAPERAPEPAFRGDIERTCRDVVEFARRVHAADVAPENGGVFRHLLVVGIGGSALGPQFLAQALGGADDRMTTHFLDNTDPDGIDRVLGGLGERLANTLTVVISKSGGTPETRNGMLEAQAAYEARGLRFGAHAAAITQAGSKLDRFADEQRFVARFPMWDWVGGRTSVTSAVGLLPAALQGVDVDELLAGAAAMDSATRRHDATANPAALLALAWHHVGGGAGERDMVILPYKDRLQLLGRYLQQLVMESLGKERDLDGRVVHQGIAVYGNKGSTDQHAYVQQLRDGLANFFVTFVEVLHDRDGDGIEVETGVTSGDFLAGFLLGTREALSDNGRPSITVSVARCDARRVGMLIALYERAVGLYATLVNVNAYHQPGVEAGKAAAAEVLELQRSLVAELARGPGTAVELAARVDRPDRAEWAFKLLERLAANPGRGVTRTPGATPFDAGFGRGD